MARPLRINYEGAVYHITLRGDGREDIYLSDDDRRMFLWVLGEVVEKYSWVCHGYCLMDNHYHLIIETPKANLSQGMRQLNGVYTQYFNKKHFRCGHVFQGRYKSIIVEKENYLLSLCRYVEQNPVRAGICKSPSEYAWCSYQYYVGIKKAPAYLTTDWLLLQFGNVRSKAIKEYIKFVNALDHKLWENLKGQIYLGGDEFIETLSDTGRSKEIPKEQRKAHRPKLKKLLEDKVDLKTILRDYGYTQKEIAEELGVHYSTVSKWLKGEK